MKSLPLLVVVLAGCSSLLPEQKQESALVWTSFDDAKAAYDRIEVRRSDNATVHRLGFDPAVTPNVEILNYSQIAQSVLPGSAFANGDEIPTGVRECLRAQDRCMGYRLAQEKLDRKRTGGFWADFLNFRRETEITGWRFSALVVLVDDKVVFKQWSGQPQIRETQVNRNPLGPLQGVGESAPSAIR